MTHRRTQPRNRNAEGRNSLLEFLAMTFLVVAVAFSAGMIVRKAHLQSGDSRQTVGLMRVDRVGRDAAAPQAQHRLAPAAAPQVIVEPVPAVPEVMPAAAKPVVAAAPVADPEPAAAPQAEPAPVVDAPTGPMFNGRPLRKARTMRMLVTAYSPDERSCGIWADGITASGYSVWTNGMKLVAADKKLFPFGAVVSVPGYNGGNPVPVLDRGGAIKGKRLDVLYPTHEIAMQWGKQWVDVTVWEYAD